MSARGLVWLALVFCLAGCKPAALSSPSVGMSDGRLAAELRRCRDLGLKAHDDPPCRAAQAERSRRFFAKPAERAR